MSMKFSKFAETEEDTRTEFLEIPACVKESKSLGN